MAGVELRRDDYEDGVLPQVCVFTGAPAEVLVEHRSRQGAGAWIVLLLLLGPVGVLAMLVVDRMLQVEARGLLPMTHAALAERTAARRRWNVVALAGAVAVAAGLAVALTAGAEVRGVGLVAAGIGVIVAVGAWAAPAFTGVTGRPDRTGRTVRLSGVAPEFARAYRAQDERRAEVRRAAGLGRTSSTP